MLPKVPAVVLGPLDMASLVPVRSVEPGVPSYRYDWYLR